MAGRIKSFQAGTAGDATHALGGRWQSSQTPPGRCFPWGAPDRTAGCEGTGPAGPPPAAPASASLGRWRTPSPPPAGLGAIWALNHEEGSTGGRGRPGVRGGGRPPPALGADGAGPPATEPPPAPSRRGQPPGSHGNYPRPPR